MTDITTAATATTVTATTAKEIAARNNALATLAKIKEQEEAERNEEIVIHFFI